MTSVGHTPPAMDGLAHADAGARIATPRGAWVAIGGLVGLSIALVLLTADVPFVAFAPLGLVVAVALFLCVPVRHLVLGLVGVGLLLDPPAGRFASGNWKSPLTLPGELLYDNLNNITGIAPLRFSALEVLLVLLLVRVVVSRAARTLDARAGRPVPPTELPVPNVMLWALGAWFGTMVWLEVYGLARGGDVRNSLWQVRELLWLPVVAWLLATVMRGPRDFIHIARFILVAACIKVAMGLYFLVAVARARGIDPPYVTTHDDSFIFVAAVIICITAALFRPTKAHLLLLVTVLPWVLLGIAINERRIAYVSLFGALLVIYSLLRGRAKRFLTLAGMAAAPLFAAYLVVGRNRPGGFFGPAAKIMSVVLQTDASSGTRDIENYNLYVTLRDEGPLFGTGFGHEYIEQIVAYDISRYFEQYRYIPHNSVLWLWSVAGVVGMLFLWLALVVAVYFAARSYRAATTSLDRIAAVTVIAVIFTYLVQAWGDMGTQAWLGVWLVAAMLAIAGKLATATGSWPEGVSLFRRERAARPAPSLRAGLR